MAIASNCNLVARLSLSSGECWTVPSGRWSIQRGKYTAFQEYDPIVGIWRTIGAGPSASSQETLFSDGVNYWTQNGLQWPGSMQAIASSATCDIGAVGSYLVQITGTTSITSFGASATTDAPIYLVTFSGILTLT